MKTNEVLQWIKTLNFKAQHYYVGANDSKKEKSIGIYALDPGPHFVPIGGLGNKIDHEKKISILVHWSQYFNESENAAYELFDELEKLEDVQIGNYTVSYIELLNDGPVNINRDDNGIFEHVIEMNIHYSKNNKEGN